ncbi:hypothetical protein [Bacillus sp. FJAT-26390]|nr:hypothetical protein [Bacillus sp. FJAT-26390]
MGIFDTMQLVKTDVSTFVRWFSLAKGK